MSTQYTSSVDGVGLGIFTFAFVLFPIVLLVFRAGNTLFSDFIPLFRICADDALISVVVGERFWADALIPVENQVCWAAQTLFCMGFIVRVTRTRGTNSIFPQRSLRRAGPTKLGRLVEDSLDWANNTDSVLQKRSGSWAALAFLGGFVP